MLKAGTAYQFWADSQGQKCNLGNIKTDTWGPDKSWVVNEPQNFKNQDYIEATVNLDENDEPEFSGPISLYDRLTVDAA